MYPTNAPGMRAFLEIFFSRHYFQIQDSLLDYIESEDFDSILEGGEIRILDIGCGPAVGVLAVTDIVMSILEDQKQFETTSRSICLCSKRYIGICLSTGQRMLNEYLIYAGLTKLAQVSTGF